MNHMYKYQVPFVWLAILLFLFAIPISAQTDPQMQMQARAIGQGSNWYSIALTLKNLGDVPLASPQLGWHYSWADHGANTVPEVDYASIAGTTAIAEDRDDYSGTVWLQIPTTLAKGDSAVVHLRVHTADYSGIQKENDPSWSSLSESLNSDYPLVTVKIGENNYLAQVPRFPFPTKAKQEALVQRVVTQKSANTLAMKITVRNSGEVPLRRVRLSWFADTLFTEQSIVAEIDWSQVPGTTLSRHILGNRVEFRIALGDGMIPVGASREIHLRLHSQQWGIVNWDNDWSETAGNIPVTSDGLIVEGKGPWTLDLDLDGVPDMVEIQVGSNPKEFYDKPLLGVPDRPWIGEITEPQYVTYDFSGIPGYEGRKNLAIKVEPGSFSNGIPPSIEYLGEDVNEPELNRPNFVRIGGFFRVHADIVAGKTIEMLIPHESEISAGLSGKSVGAFRFDTGTNSWEPLKVVGYDGAVHVTTKKFSTVQVGQYIVTRNIVAGDSHVVILDTMTISNQLNGRLFTMGKASKGRLGIPQGTAADYWELVPVWGIPDKDLISVAAGSRHSMVLTKSGLVYAWGDNSHGQLGNSTVTDTTWMPVKVTFPVGTPQIINITAGAEHSMAQDLDGNMWVWGRNTEGQLGLKNIDGTIKTTNVAEPQKMEFPTEGGIKYRFTQIVGGSDFSFALDSLQRPWSWGKNDKGQLFIPTSACNTLIANDGLPGMVTNLTCTYTTDALIHGVERTTFQGYNANYENLATDWDGWGKMAASGKSAVVHRAYPRLYENRFGITIAWGEASVIAVSDSFYSTKYAAGAVHLGRITTQHSTVQTPPAGMPAGYTLINSYVEDGNTWYKYRFDKVHLFGDNSNYALASPSVTARSNVFALPLVHDLALGSHFSAALIQTRDLEKQLRIVGKMGSRSFGAAGAVIPTSTTTPKLKVEITSPLPNTVYPRNSTEEFSVEWQVNGVKQTDFKFKMPGNYTEGQVFTVTKAYTDAFGQTGTGTVSLVAKSLAVSNLSISGNIQYYSSSSSNTKATIAVTLNQSMAVALKAVNKETGSTCYYGTGVVQNPGPFTMDWDGTCNDGLGGASTGRITDGYHSLQVLMKKMGLIENGLIATTDLIVNDYTLPKSIALTSTVSSNLRPVTSFPVSGIVSPRTNLVEYLVDGVVVASTSSSSSFRSFTKTFNLTALSNGPHTFQLRAKYGTTFVSPVYAFNIIPDPVVEITSPVAGAVFPLGATEPIKVQWRLNGVQQEPFDWFVPVNATEGQVIAISKSFTNVLGVIGTGSVNVVVKSLALKNVETKYPVLLFPNETQELSFDITAGAKLFIEFWEKKLPNQVVAQLPEQSYSAGSVVVFWDGRGLDGKRVPTGVYGVTIRAEGAYGSAATYKSEIELSKVIDANQGIGTTASSRFMGYGSYQPLKRAFAKLAIVKVRDGAVLSNEVDGVFDGGSSPRLFYWTTPIKENARMAVLGSWEAGSMFEVAWDRPSIKFTRSTISVADLDLMDVQMEGAQSSAYEGFLVFQDGTPYCALPCQNAAVPITAQQGWLKLSRKTNGLVDDEFQVPMWIGGAN